MTATDHVSSGGGEVTHNPSSPGPGAVPAPLPHDEEARLAALHSFEILDTLPEQAYDDIALLASQICRTPIALISLVDEDRQWFKSKIGLESRETPRELAFCAHAILEPGELLAVPDASADPRFATNPLVTADPSIRFYAGAPLVTSGGHALGTLCVIDQQPRELSQDERDSLEALSRQVVAQLELRRTVAELRADRLAREAVERERDRFFNLSGDLLCIATFDGLFKRLNPAWETLLGWSSADLSGKPFLDFVHPSDREGTIEELAALADGAQTVNFENRYRHTNGTYRSLSWNAVPDLDDGVVYATARDVTERRKELIAARAIQECLQPEGLSRVSGFCVPARDIGGDFFGWLPASDGSLLLYVGDVMGKGIAAALVTSAVNTALRTSLQSYGGLPDELGRIVDDVHQQLGSYLAGAGAFVTLFVAAVNSEHCAFVDAGHGHALITRPEGSAEWLRGRNLPLGISLDEDYQVVGVSLDPGSKLVVFTDGYAESAGLESLDEWTLEASSWSADAGASAIAEELRSRLPRAAQYADDATLVVAAA